jgi:hypothetical protein
MFKTVGVYNVLLEYVKEMGQGVSSLVGSIVQRRSSHGNVLHVVHGHFRRRFRISRCRFGIGTAIGHRASATLPFPCPWKG